MLFSSPGSAATLLWSFVRCAVDEFSSFSGVDTITCQSCPAGADCSGNSLSSSLLTVEAPTGAVATSVVVQQYIAAQSGYWASEQVWARVAFVCV